MPELPEVETMVRGIRPYIINRPIQNFAECPNTCKPILMNPVMGILRRRLVGKQFTEVSRLGKRIVFHVSDASHLVVEPRMTGLVLLQDPPDVEHLRLRCDFEPSSEFNSFWFWDRRGLGTVTLYEPETLKTKSVSLGTDALTMSQTLWTQSCLKTARDIKAVLLDQSVVAGIGNIYASEILHRAAIDPRAPANSLDEKIIAKLVKAVRSILLKAIECEGSTLGDGTYRNALNQNGSYQNQHRVYKREGETCLTCRIGQVQRIIQAQRSTFYCPECQTNGRTL